MANESFFDILKSICNHDRKDWKDIEHLYNPFLINKGLSMQESSMFFANWMNKYHSIPNRMQYDFLFYTYSGAKFIKWVKKDKEEESDKIDFLMSHYEISEPKAKEIAPLYSDKKIEELKEKYYYNKQGQDK